MMAGLPYVDEQALLAVLPMRDAIDVLEQAARGALPASPRRQHLHADAGELIFMPAWGAQGVGVKLLTNRPDNPRRGFPLVQGVFVMFSADDGRPVGVVDGAALTALRTAAVSGLAARHLARPDAKRLVIFGAGRQAHAHLDALCAIRPIQSVTVVGRDPDRVAALVAKATALGLEARRDEPTAVESADLVCACTTSRAPVVEGERLPDGVHVTGVGACHPHTRELDDATLRRSSVFVDNREGSLAESGDLSGWSSDMSRARSPTSSRVTPGDATRRS